LVYSGDDDDDDELGGGAGGKDWGDLGMIDCFSFDD